MLFEDRDHLVDQGLKFIIAGVLAILLEHANQSFVIGLGLLQEESVKIETPRRLQFPFQLLLSLSVRSNVSLCLRAIFQVRSALLGHRNYGLIDIGMILDQLICVSPDLVC